MRNGRAALSLFNPAGVLPRPTLGQVHAHLRVGLLLRWMAIGVVAAGSLMVPAIPGILPLLVAAAAYNGLAMLAVSRVHASRLRLVALGVTTIDQVFCFTFLGLYGSHFSSAEPLGGYLVGTIEGIGYFGVPGAILSLGMFCVCSVVTLALHLPLFTHAFDVGGIAGALLLLSLPTISLVAVFRIMLPAATEPPVARRSVAIHPDGDGAPAVRLSPRERQVLALVAEGYSNTMIATRLGLSDTTVKSYVENLLLHLNVRNRAEAVAAASRLKLL